MTDSVNKSSTMPKHDELWRKALLPNDATMQQAIRLLNDASLQIALVVTTDGRLVGTLTDGDIRRGLLRGLKMDDSVDSIVRREPLVVPPQMSRDKIGRAHV